MSGALPPIATLCKSRAAMYQCLSIPEVMLPRQLRRKVFAQEALFFMKMNAPAAAIATMTAIAAMITDDPPKPSESPDRPLLLLPEASSYITA